MQKAFDCFVGIDQTGAVLEGGRRAKPLHTAVLRKTVSTGAGKRGRSPEWRLELVLLPSLSRPELEKVRGMGALGTTAIIADCVFGLPHPVALMGRANPSQALWRLLCKTRRAGKGDRKYGMPVAEAFFRSLLPADYIASQHPTRVCEGLACANSVFRARPFQKNIQTGTYRIWRDIAGEGERWLNFWPFERSGTELSGCPWIFEGFPSLLWRTVFNQRTRDLSQLRGSVRKVLGDTVVIDPSTWKIILSNADYADATVLALGGLELQNQGRLFTPFTGFEKTRTLRSEGWIVGLDLEGKVS